MFVYVFRSNHIPLSHFRCSRTQKKYHFSLLLHISLVITYSFGSRLFVGKNKYAYFIACNKVIILCYLKQTQAYTQPLSVGQGLSIKVQCAVRTHSHTQPTTQSIYSAMRCDAYIHMRRIINFDVGSNFLSLPSVTIIRTHCWLLNCKCLVIFLMRLF